MPQTLIPFGPTGSDVLPARFTVQHDCVDRPLRLTITASFDGVHRVKAESVRVERTDGESVSPLDLTTVRLAEVMRHVVVSAMNEGHGPAQPSPTEPPLLTLARIYWLEHVSWGQPTKAITAHFGIPKSTANHRIRKARVLYALPGPHAKED